MSIPSKYTGWYPIWHRGLKDADVKQPFADLISMCLNYGWLRGCQVLVTERAELIGDPLGGRYQWLRTDFH